MIVPDLTKEASEKCGVTFETEAEDDERYYCEEDDGEYEEGEGYYPGDEYYGDGEDEEYVYGDNYEEPEEGEIFGYDEEGQLTDLDHVQSKRQQIAFFSYSIFTQSSIATALR